MKKIHVFDLCHNPYFDHIEIIENRDNSNTFSLSFFFHQQYAGNIIDDQFPTDYLVIRDAVISISNKINDRFLSKKPSITFDEETSSPYVATFHENHFDGRQEKEINANDYESYHTRGNQGIYIDGKKIHHLHLDLDCRCNKELLLFIFEELYDDKMLDTKEYKQMKNTVRDIEIEETTSELLKKCSALKVSVKSFVESSIEQNKDAEDFLPMATNIHLNNLSDYQKLCDVNNRNNDRLVMPPDIENQARNSLNNFVKNISTKSRRLVELIRNY